MMLKIGFMRQVANEKREGRSRVSLTGLSFCSLNLARSLLSESARQTVATLTVGRERRRSVAVALRVYSIFESPVIQRSLLVSILLSTFHLSFNRTLTANRAECTELFGRQHAANLQFSHGTHT